MSVGDFYDVVLQQQLHGQTILNTFRFLQTAGATGNTSPGLATNFAVSVAAPLLSHQSEDVSQRFLFTTRVDPKPRALTVITDLGGPVGGILGASLPSSVALVFTKNTANSGRGERGRWFFAGINRIHENASVLNSAGITEWSPLASALFNSVTDGTTTWAPQLARQLPDGAGGVQEVGVGLSQVLLRSTLRNQRRRQVGVGI